MGIPAERVRGPRRGWHVLWPTSFAVLFGAAVWLSTAQGEWGSAWWLFPADLVLGAGSVVAMQFRGRWPVAATVLTSAATAVSASANGAWVVCQASLATRRRWPEILPTAALGVVTALVYNAVQPGPDLSWRRTLVFCTLMTGVVVAVGMYVGARRDLVASLRDRAERAEREQEMQVISAQAGERTRIAREMHDVLAHRMSLVALHAGALAYRTDLGPADVRGTAAIIQANSQRALADLREILGLLRDTEGGIDATEHRPQPTLDDLGTLLDDERAAGARITLRSGVEDVEALPTSVGRNAYRILQEGLTNARKHAPHAAVTVELAGRPGTGLDLSVRNPVPVGGDRPCDGSGFGLVGLAERAAASHGRFEHGLTPDGEFVVRAWLPWDR